MKLPSMKNIFLITLLCLLATSRVFAAIPSAPVSNASSPSVASSAALVVQQKKVTLDDLLGKPEASVAAKPTTTATAKAMSLAMSSSAAGDTGTRNFAKTLSVDPQSGSPVVAIPLSFPQGRGGVSPDLGLFWSPTGGNGPLGWGWSMDMGTVVRSTKNGVPHYDTTDTFLVSFSGKNYELVSLGVNNEYRSKFDDDRMRFFFNNGVWSAKDKTGTTYCFGSRSGSAVSDGGTKVFKWKLDRIEDLFGNVLVVDYGADGSFEVRYGLMVGKSTTTDVNNKVNFAYVITASVQSSDRSDVFTDYKPGFAVSEKRLVSRLTVTGGGNLIRTYNFTYAPSARTGRSLLKSVTEVGSDNTTTQPVVNLQYNDAESAPYAMSSIVDPLQGDNLWSCTILQLDYNPSSPFPKVINTSGPYVLAAGSVWGVNWATTSGGSLSINGPASAGAQCSSYLYTKTPKTVTLGHEIACPYGGCALSINNSPWSQYFSQFALSAGYNLVSMLLDGHPLPPAGLQVSLNTEVAAQVDVMNSSQVIFPQLAADFNGDGKADVATYFSATGTIKVALSSSSGFLPKTTWIDNFGKNAKIILGDFNGDGRTDIAAFDPTAGTVRVALSDGTKFSDSGIWLSTIAVGADIYTGDFNADGRTDLYIMTKDTLGWKLQVAVSSGSAFSMGSAYRPQMGSANAVIIPADMNGDGLTDLVGFDQAAGTWSVHLNTNGFGSTGYYSVSGFGVNKPPVVADFNQDGRMDIGYFDAIAKQVVYRPSVTGGFASPQTRTFNFTLTDAASTQLQIADFNGDGVLDFMTFDSMGRMDIAMSSGKFQDLMTSYDNGFGGSMSLVYASSSDFSNTYMPFAFPVVQSVAATNHLGDSFTTNYSYTGGYWNPTDREMYGFKETRVIDAEGNYAISQFNQENLYLRGHLDRTATYGKDGKIYQETKFQWNNDPVVSGRTDVRCVSLRRVDNFMYDTVSAAPVNLRTAVQYTYDLPLGVPTEVRDYGDVDWTTGADTGNDYIRTVMTYGSNTVNNVLGVLTSKTAYDKDNNVLGKNYAYYDGSTALGSVVRGLPTRSDRWNKIGTTESLLSETRIFNSYGQVVTNTDALNHATTIMYDPTWSVFPLTTTNAKSFQKTRTYYGINGEPLSGGVWGLPKTVTDANAQTATIVYDALGRVTAEIAPLDSLTYPTVIYEYQTRINYRVLIARKRIEHGPSATLDSYAYVDGLGRTLAVKSPSAIAGKYVVSGQVTLNNRGLVAKEYPPYFSTKDYNVLELPNAATWGTTYEYDVLGRKTRTTFPDENYAVSSYTPTTTSVIDPNGHKTVNVRDARGQVIRIENYTGASGQSDLYPAQNFALYAATAYAYNLLGDLVSVTDAKGNIMSMTYDALGHKITMNDPDMHNVSYEYDALGQLIKQTDAKNIAFAFTYDVLGRPSTKSRADTGMDKVAYTYDLAAASNSKGRLSQVEYLSGEAEFGYDVLGQETSVAKTMGSDMYSVKRAYDALGRLKSLEYPDGKTSVIYGYDAAGQVNTVTMKVLTNGVQVSRPIITAVEYTANGSIQMITYGNGAVATYAYNPVMIQLLRQRIMNKDGMTVQLIGYAYDAVGNIIYSENNNGNAKSYSYDSLNRMVTSQDGADALRIYRYDELGNMIQKDGLTYTYGANGAGAHAVTSISDGSSMTYDANGNMASYRTVAKTQYYTYDTFNRLVKVEGVDAGTARRYLLAQYVFDGDGGRTKKIAYANYGGTVTNYVGELMEETDGLLTDFVFLGPTRVAAYDGTKIRWFVGDHVGSTGFVLDEDSAVKEKIAYTPWGEVKSFEKYDNTPEVAWFYFTGKRLDDETGLYYFGARYYNPKIGRFITPDTIVQAVLNPQTLNRYSYCNNNPVNLVDPTGHKWRWKSFTSGFIGGVVGAFVTIATGGLGAPIAFALGGMAGGAVSGGLSSGWQGALLGAAMGGVLGGAVGGGISAFGQGFGYAALAGGAGYSIATGHTDALIGGLSGGIVGTGIGSYFFDGISKTSADPRDYTRWDIRGVGTTEEEAMSVAELKQSAVFSVRSRGVLSDFVRAGMEKILGPGCAARQLAGYMVGADGVNFYAHSEGTMLLAQAMKVNISDGIRLPGSSFDFNAPVIMRSTAQGLANQIGAGGFGYHLNSFDPIGVFTTPNPVLMAVYGVAGIITAFHFHSGTTYSNLGI